MAREPESYIAKDLFEVGLGEVVVCRFKSGGRVEAGIFLVDVFCLGVKNAFFVTFPSEDEFRATLLVRSLSGVAPRPGSRGRKLVEDAVAYAASLGISPHSDYKKGAKVFGGIDASACQEEFVFGRDGRPLFIQGPDDTPEKIARIHAVLRARLGGEGYDFEEPVFGDEWEAGGRVIVATDSQPEGDEPDPLLVDFAEDFLEQHEEFSEILYADREESLAAAALLESARLIQKEVFRSGLPCLPLDAALTYVQTLWNLQMVSEEARKEALAQMPEPQRKLIEESFANIPLPEAEDSILILGFLLLQADQPGNERVLLLTAAL